MRLPTDNLFRWTVLTASVLGALSVVGLVVAMFLDADDFVSLGVRFAGISEDMARPIVMRLFVAMKIAFAVLPFLLFLLAIGVRYRHILARLNSLKSFAWLTVVAALLSFPNPVMPALPGLDNSWQWLLSRLTLKGVFGVSTVFTYGPLGGLLFPQMPMVNVVLSLVANGLFLIAWSWFLIRLFASCRRARAAAWPLLFTMLFPQSNMEWRWVALAILATTVPVVVPKIRNSWVMFAIGGVTLAIVSFMKFSSLIIVASSQVLAVVVRVLWLRRGIRDLVAWLVAFVLTFAALSFVLYPSEAALVSWVKGSMAIASGYNRYMVDSKSLLELLIPFAVLTATLLAFPRRRACTRIVPVFIAFAPVFFCTMKYALVRQGPFPMYYVLAVFLALAASLLPAVCRRFTWVIVSLYGVSMVFTLPRAVAGDTPNHFGFGVNPMGIVRSVRLEDSVSKTAVQSAYAIGKNSVFPNEWWNKIGRQKVQFLPDEFYPAMMRENCNFCLIPSFQLYSAYLPALDAACADVYASSDAPEWLAVHVDPKWCGYFVNHPQTWNGVMACYSVDDIHKDWILMRRRTDSGRVRKNVGLPKVRPQDVAVGEWVDCRDWKDRLFSVDWPQTKVGKLSTLFLRNTMLWLTMRYDDGTEAKIQFNPENCSYPFPFSKIAVTAEDFIAVLKGGSARIPSSIRFDADTPGLYEPKLLVHLQPVAVGQ